MRALIRRRKRSFTAGAATVAIMVCAFIGMRMSGPALAESGSSPYTVVQVQDINPDPDIVETTIVAEEAGVDIGIGADASVLTFNGTVPGPEFRLKVGDTVIVHFRNEIAHATGIHWHGIEVANASDGTPLTQNMVAPNGGTFLYKFTVTRPGIFWYHPHHHSSTNQVFKGMYGSIIVTDPSEAALQGSGTLPAAADTRTLVLSDLTVCKEPGFNDTVTYPNTLPHVSGGMLPAQAGPTPQKLCEAAPAGEALDEDGNPRGNYAAGDVPNNQKPAPNTQPINEGQTVLTNGMNVGGRAGSPLAPGALDGGAFTLPVEAGQGLRLQLVNAATTRFFRLILTDANGVQIPLVRVGGQGGLIDNARVEGDPVTPAPVGVFGFQYTTGEILLDPGDRADVVAAIPSAALDGDVLTMWTQDFRRTGGNGFANIPTVPVAHFLVNGARTAYTLAPGTPIRAATGNPVEALGAATISLLDPSAFAPAKPGMSSQEVQLTAVGGPPGVLGVNGVMGLHDFPGDYTGFPHEGSSRYAAAIGGTLELTVRNMTGAHHPFHLHGFSIQPLDLTRAGNPTYTFPYSEFRDNIDVPANYTLRFRVRLDDRPLMDGVTPGGGLGRWVFHCHIFFHAVFGMISEFNVVAADGNERPNINSNATLVTGNASTPLEMQGTYSDPDGDTPIALSASVGTITDNGSGQWTWTQTGAVSGLVFVRATDAGGLSDQIAFALDVNASPALVLPGAQSGQFSDVLSFGVSATDADAGDTVTLSATLPPSLTFLDNGDRTGTVSGTPTALPGVHSAMVTASDGVNGPVTGAVEITIQKEATTLQYTGPTVFTSGVSATLSALLLEDDSPPIVGRGVSFALGAQTCVGVTNASGIASCDIVPSGSGSLLVTATFAGDPFYLPSFASSGSPPTPPAPFDKTAPASGVTNLPPTVAFSWTASGTATGYEVCVDTSNNNICDTGWMAVGLTTTSAIGNLAPSTTYYWHVQATNASGFTEANAGAWWSFTTRAFRAARLTQPVRSVRLPGQVVAFAWDQGVNVVQYSLFIGSSPGAGDIYMQNQSGLSRVVSNLPVDGRLIYVRLYSRIGDVWVYVDEVFVAALASSSTFDFDVVPMQGDFDGDGVADLVTWWGGPGVWQIVLSSTGFTQTRQVYWGRTNLGDRPVAGDFDGDGKTDPAVWRAESGLWLILLSTTNDEMYLQLSWGRADLGDVPVPADFDGDGKTDPAVWRRDTGYWYALRSSTNYTEYIGVPWGREDLTDRPVPGDYDGDNKADPAVWRALTGDWFILSSVSNYTSYLGISWGREDQTDQPVPADYDGDGRMDLAVWRRNTGFWYILKSSQSYTVMASVQLGDVTLGDRPVPGRFLGNDLKADPAVWRPFTGDWFRNTSPASPPAGTTEGGAANGSGASPPSGPPPS